MGIADLGNRPEIPVLRAAICAQGNEIIPTAAHADQLASMLCTADFEIDSRRLRMALTRARGTGSFTLGIGPDGDASSAHLIHVTAPEKIGVHSEVRDVAGVRLLVLLLQDVAPRALRVAVVEPVTRRVSQFVVLDSSVAPEETGGPTAEPSDPLRELLLGAYLESFSSVAPSYSPGVPITAMAPALQGTEVKITANQHYIMLRGVRKLPSGQPVVLSIVREQACGKVTRFRILMYHPVSGRETFLFLTTPLLDDVLAEVGLEHSRLASVEDVDAKKDTLAALILKNIYVHPDGAEMELRPTHTSSSSPKNTNLATDEDL